MDKYERASQAWAVLAWAARHRQTLTYQHLGQATGMHPAGIGMILDPIQDYCRDRNLPPLTVLVVQKDTGLPSSGFTAAQAVQTASDQAKVFSFDWLSYGNPQVQGLRDRAVPVIEEVPGPVS
ncbi:hypothetical protein F8S09_15480 [Deinococcus sp. SDU3-2]|uniref:Uncharacterized protein n=1 Tax=Deinococcus terrestris TaxID=2651870 RepID=A0A7X1NYB6_9DEIO|nr:hypothetical protein [Deinococcus terrestris]MPY68057.1 hypothetical protein [Deinococcus terrestris]